MRPPDLRGGRSAGRGGFPQRLIRLVVAGTGPPPGPEALTALLLPVVGRAVRTGRGPAALVRWLRRAGRPGGTPPAYAARALTDELVRLVLVADRPADTFASPDTAPAVGAPGAGYGR